MRILAAVYRSCTDYIILRIENSGLCVHNPHTARYENMSPVF